MQSTTSTANSGLYDHLLPIFEAETGIKVNVVAVGTGQAIRNARNCDGDVLAGSCQAAPRRPSSPTGFGTASQRFDLMYNDFVIVGPEATRPASRHDRRAGGADARIAGAEALFASRGDDSGTHKKEMSLWADAGIDPRPRPRARGTARPARAWARRSTPASAWAPMS